ncbi:membrane-bound lytic murein transglycosylase MltF [Pseudomonadota bacterium]
MTKKHVEPSHHTPFHKRGAPVTLVIVAIALLPLFLIYDRPRGNALDDVKQSGVLKVLTINSPTTYYESSEHARGLEFELASGLAEKLRVELSMETADSLASVLPRLARGDSHFAAAGLIVNDERKQMVKFTPPYQEIKQQVVFLKGEAQPESIADLVGRDIAVVAGSSAALHLNALKAAHPQLVWEETSSKSPEELLYDVWQGNLEVTITYSNVIAITRHHYPKLEIAFDLKDPEQLAWAFRRDGDNSIYRIAVSYLDNLKATGELDRLLERYYGVAESFNYINITEYRRKIESVLPLYRSLFQEAGERTGFDWRLLAAIAYQESYWDPGAISPTGVKGIMQLTKATAEQVDVNDRTDPRQSILGGADYLKVVRRKIPKRIQEPDRTWFALAAYNLGFGHFEDARILTQRAGKSPDTWVDVKEFLPLLSEPEWYEQTKYGEARGGEALSFVTRVRAFYDVLVRIDQEAEASTDITSDLR